MPTKKQWSKAFSQVRQQEEIPDARGTMMCQIDCPECNSVFDLEGDRDGEVVECPDCHTKLKVRRF